MAVYSGSGISLVCCNGGLPYVALPTRSAKFDSSNEPDAYNCQRYQLTFADEQARRSFDQLRLNVACECGGRFQGARCQTKDGNASLDKNDSQKSYAFKMSLLLAVIPLSFALFAAIGGFFCKVFPCLACFELDCSRTCRKKPASEGDVEDELYYNEYSRPPEEAIHVDVHSVDLTPVPMWDPNSGQQQHVLDIVGEATVREAAWTHPRQLVDDPPPPFSDSDPNHCCKCNRKNSPPPPYSEIAQSTSSVVRYDSLLPSTSGHCHSLRPS